MTLIVRPGFQFDDDASTYIEAVEAADTQALETNVRYAINNFVIGCKQDGTWSAIKASCILAGARTLTGALVPLAGTAPTNPGNVFVSGDYNRKTGLVGNGSTKYLLTNRNNNSDPQDNFHLSAYVSAAANSGLFIIGCRDNTNSSQSEIYPGGGGIVCRARVNANVILGSSESATGFVGTVRAQSASWSGRVQGLSGSASQVSTTPTAVNLTVFARNTSGSIGSYANPRLAFYSVGESLSLALLDARVTDLITAIGAAIP